MHCLSILVTLLPAIAIAYSCTKGAPLTAEEFREYQSLNDTTGWAPLDRIKHCRIDESDSQISDKLETRAGRRRYVAYASLGCSNDVLFGVEGFGCGECYSASSEIAAGLLWRQALGNPYPTADYYSGTGCTGRKVHHQGIPGNYYDWCEPVQWFGARSVFLYQGC